MSILPCIADALSKWRDRRRLAPRRIMLLAAVFAILVAILSVYLAVQTPWLGIHFAPRAGGSGLSITAVEAGYPNATRVSRGEVATALVDSNGTRVPLTALTITGEPGDFPSYDAFNAFLAHQDALSRALATRSLHLELASGQLVPVTTMARPVSSLPPYFWWQIVMGAICLMISAGVWAFQRGQAAARLLLVSGIGVVIFTAMAAVYSTRELALGANVFHLLSGAVHLGISLHAAALLAMLWVYPCRLSRNGWIPALCFAGAGLAWLSSVFQLMPSDYWSDYFFINAAFAVGAAFVIGQWRATRNRPVERAVLRLFVLAIFLASIINIALLRVPVFLGWHPPIASGWLFIIHPLMYTGLALGVIRFRLFNLGHWWIRTWTWFFSGVAILLIEMILFFGLDMGQAQALFLSFALVGWLYFPIREWMWTHVTERKRGRLHELLPRLTSGLARAKSQDGMHAEWAQVLKEDMAPLVLRELWQHSNKVKIVGSGTALKVPGLDPARTLILYYPADGGRLFDTLDVKRVEALLDVAQRVATAIQAREEGARTERERIMRDLHDDLGARLLSVVYAAKAEKTQRLARAAIDDLHEVLAAARSQTITLGDATEEWSAECTSRLREAGIEVHCDISRPAPSLPAEPELSSRLYVNIGRIVREAVSNIIQHADAKVVDVRFVYAAGVLEVTLDDDGTGGGTATWESGNGLRTMKSRADDMGASIEWRQSESGGCQVWFSLTLDRMVATG